MGGGGWAILSRGTTAERPKQRKEKAQMIRANRRAHNDWAQNEGKSGKVSRS